MVIDAIKGKGRETSVTRRILHEQSITTAGREGLTSSARESRVESGARFPDRIRRKREFSDLYTECISALAVYTGEAWKLCQMLAEVNGKADRADEQVSLMAQRERERDAHVEYLRARKRVLRRAQLSSR
jgi:hypothetical protein